MSRINDVISDEDRERIIQLVDSIVNFARNNPDTEDNSKKLSELYEVYETYCYEHGIPVYNYLSYERGLDNVSNISFIIQSEPEIVDMDEEKVALAWNHLLDTLENGGGITEEEAQLLLTWSVQKTRTVLFDTNKDFGGNNKSLIGMCGYSRMLSLVAFNKSGLKVTINNTSYFAESVSRHGFGTITLPIEKDGIVEEKQYLLDVTYRQFFSTIKCIVSKYYSPDNRVSSCPDVGYYMVNYLDGKEIAKEILKKGYIELTPEVLKKYACSFIVAGLNITDKDRIIQIINEVNIGDLKRIIEEEQEKFGEDEEELEEILEIVGFPSLNHSLK